MIYCLFLDKIAPDLARWLLSGDSNKVFPIIVQVNDELTDTDESIIKEIGGVVKARLSIINSFSTELDMESIKKLAENPRIKKIYYDGEVFAI